MSDMSAILEEVQRLFTAMVASNMEQDNVALWKQERVTKMMVVVRQCYQQGTDHHTALHKALSRTTSLERLTTLQQAIAVSSFTYSDYATLLEKITNTNTLATDAHQYLTSASTFYNDGGGGKVGQLQSLVDRATALQTTWKTLPLVQARHAACQWITTVSVQLQQ